MKTGYCLVRYKHLWLTPMKLSRCYSLKKRKECKIFKDKFTGLLVCKLLRLPSGFNVNKGLYTAGFDPGSLFNNISVVSDKDQYTIQHNTEVNHIKTIQSKVKLRSEYRRLRRLKLRWRKCRISNRTGSKITNTTNYFYLIRFQLIKELSKRFHFNNINIEECNVAYSKSFQYINQGKIKLVDSCSKLGIKINFIKGNITKFYRTHKLGKPIYDDSIYDNEYDNKLSKIIGYTEVKNYNKSDLDWYCHSVDSFILATLGKDTLPFHHNFYLMTKSYSYRKDGKKLRPSHRRPHPVPRKSKNARYRTYHKIHKIRVKINDSKSNHGPWIYKYVKDINPGFIPKAQFESGYTDYQGRYYKKLFNKPICKFRDPITLRYNYYNVILINFIDLGRLIC